MGIIEIALIGIGLAMDAFAVSICKGLSMKKLNWKKAIIIALYFGIFQALMPIFGYFLGTTFDHYIINLDHWVAFVLLGVIGINMFKEAIWGESESVNDSVDFKTMIVLAIATSIDALAVGITFTFLKTNMILATLVIGIITFIICILGVKIGNKFGSKHGAKAELFGGVILIILGTKILLEHLGII